MFGLYHQIALALFAGFILAELILPGRAFPTMRLWRIRAALSTLAYFAVATFAPLLWDGALGAHRLFDATALPFWAQVLGGFLALELGVYAWHRTMHNLHPLWRWFHQMHHSAERIDIWAPSTSRRSTCSASPFSAASCWCSASASAARRL